MQKTEKPNEATTSGSRLPFNSDKGAQRIGPVAKPNTYNDVPSVATTEPTWNSCSIARIAVLNIALAKEAVKVVNPYHHTIRDTVHISHNTPFHSCSRTYQHSTRKHLLPQRPILRMQRVIIAIKFHYVIFLRGKRRWVRFPCAKGR
jgi:hypothetical protein